MENNVEKKRGRPEVATEKRKKNRALSLTNDEYKALETQKTQAGYKSVSAYVVAKLGLNVVAKPSSRAKI